VVGPARYLSWIDGSTNASAAASNGGASAFSTLRRDSSKADLKRSQEEIGTAVDLVYAVAQAAAQGNWGTSSV
jgi:hypothetical protein